MKRCAKCSIEKSNDEFRRNARRKDGYSCSCRMCDIAYDVQYRALNPNKAREAQERFKKSGKKAESQRLYRAKNSVYIKNIKAERDRRPDIRAQYIQRRREDLDASRRKESEAQKRSVNSLSDGYIRHVLRSPMLNAADIPRELIEAKRMHLRLVRLLKENQ